MPLITYSPETSLRLGLLGIYIFRLPTAKPGTLLSSIRAPFSYTLENQIKLKLSYEIFLDDNKRIFSGFIQWQKFPLLFYGIGPNSLEINEELYTNQNFAFNFGMLKKIGAKTYFGGQVAWQKFNVIDKKELGLLTQDGLIPGNNGGIVAGTGISFRYDNRDNNVNAGRGPYVETLITTYQKIFSSNFEFTKLTVDARHFIHLFQKHVVAFQMLFENNWGNPGFEDLALLGGDVMMRGHYQGRFRDKSFWAVQTEYRLPFNRPDWFADNVNKLSFWKRGGIVGFAGLGAVAPDLSSFKPDEIKYSIGFGFRFLVMPDERMNVRLDFGFGTQQPGFYFNLREAF